LKVTTERLEECVANVTIEVDDDTIQPALVKAAKKASGRFQIPGFRKGHAPFDVVRRLVGEDYLFQEAVEEMGPALVERALKEQEIEPYSRPELTDVKLRPLRLTVAVPLEPKVTLGDYRSIHIDRPSAEVTDEDVQKVLDALRRGRAIREPVDRPVQVGDLVTGTLAVEVVGETIERPPEDEVTFKVPETGQGIPGLSEHLAGAKVGDVVEFGTVTKADDVEPGKPANVRVEVRAVEEEHLPEVNEDLAVLLGDYENLDALMTELRARLEREAKQRAEAELRRQAVDALVQSTEIFYPKAAVEDQMDNLVETLERQLRQQRISLEAYLKTSKMTPEQWRERQRPNAERILRQTLAMRGLVKAEGIEVSNEELRARADRTIANVGADAEMQKVLRSPQFQLGVKNNMLYDRAVRRLISIVTGETEAPEEEIPAEEVPAAPVSVIEVSEGEEHPTGLEEVTNA